MVSLTYRYYLEPEALSAESGIKGIEVPMQPTVETVVNVPDGTDIKQIEQLDAAMSSRGYVRTSIIP